MKVLLRIAPEATTFCCFFQTARPPDAFFSERLVTDALKTFKEIVLTKGVVNEHDELSGTNNVFVPASQSCHSSMACFGLPEKPFVIIVGTGNMRMVVAREKPFPEALCVTH
ncbi:hypothetical protein MO973_26300 [Paenibacillus sp. TRM 82003]|nr:hypothetical protein [Paenibacillus sp. TRM 82003]MCI3919381.1 hypothetical protein [Paenibacillus sp. TRM 82003]MCI3919739.1 hypothetical protein [Paenibacillus sp. TRM 82003]MCI3920720.1 hypothetical protein [Paenibacillus sp. TRM 82003]MCI3920908.1 hypothetical protein [Paenibacillus sp. TRM 82003]